VSVDAVRHGANERARGRLRLVENDRHGMPKVAIPYLSTSSAMRSRRAGSRQAVPRYRPWLGRLRVFAFDDAVISSTGSPRFHNLIERSCRPSPKMSGECGTAPAMSIQCTLMAKKADQCGVRPGWIGVYITVC